MQKRWTAWIAISLLLAAVLDVASTYFASPDLSGEANPLVSALGRNWPSILVIKSVGSLVCLFIFNYSLTSLRSRRERLSGLSGFWCVMSHLVYERQLSLSEFLLRGGIKDLGAYASFIGLSVTMGILLGSIAASITNSFGLIHSHEEVIAFWCITGVSGVAIGALSAYRFLTADNTAEQVSGSNG